MVKQITPERAIEAIQICSEFMTENMVAYQSILFPKSLKIAGTAIISCFELEKLSNADFNCTITSSTNVTNWGIELSIYDIKE